jgi:hypothetical protein
MDVRINCAPGANAVGQAEQLEQRLRSANPNNSNDCGQQIQTDQTIVGGESDQLQQLEQRLWAANPINFNNSSNDCGRRIRSTRATLAQPTSAR